MDPVIVVGGGITGLAAAYELSARRTPFVLLEASPRAGGLILTEHIDGFTIEAGPDSMLAQKPAAIALCEELGLGPKLISTSRPRTAFILANGRLYRLPSRSVLGIPITWSGILRYELLPPLARVRLTLEPLAPRGDGKDESVAAFFRRRFGRATVDLIAQPLLGGIHAGDVEQLSMRSSFPRFVQAETQKRSVLRTFAKTPPRGPEGLFRSLASGMGELVSALERRLPPECVRYDTPVRALARDAEGWSVMSRAGMHRASAVILAVPAHAAARIVSGVDDDAARLCAEVPYASTVSVSLAWPREAIAHPLAGSGFVVARTPEAPRITACTWVSSKWGGRVPAGHALLRAFLGGAHDPSAADLSDQEIVDVVTREVSTVLGITVPASFARIHRWRNAGAQHNVGQAARVEALESRLANSPGVFVAGSGFRSIGIPDCIADGRAAAAAASAFVRQTDRGES